MRSKFQYFLLLLATLATLAFGSDQNNSTLPPTITVKHATLVGFSNHGLDFFLGIPFAQPLVNALRFAPPNPISEQLGIVNASSEGKSCYRLEHTLTLQGSEDCLHLDVVALLVLLIWTFTMEVFYR
jgi:hypothetical protein